MSRLTFSPKFNIGDEVIYSMMGNSTNLIVGQISSVVCHEYAEHQAITYDIRVLRPNCVDFYTIQQAPENWITIINRSLAV